MTGENVAADRLRVGVPGRYVCGERNEEAETNNRGGRKQQRAAARQSTAERPPDQPNGEQIYEDRDHYLGESRVPSMNAVSMPTWSGVDCWTKCYLSLDKFCLPARSPSFLIANWQRHRVASKTYALGDGSDGEVSQGLENAARDSVFATTRRPGLAATKLGYLEPSGRLIQTMIGRQRLR